MNKHLGDDIEDSAHHLGDHEHDIFSIYDLYYYDEIRKIRLSLPWIIITFGLIGNILILVVFMQKLRRRNSNAFCFCALAISDSFALIFMLFRALLKSEILSNLNVTCKLIKYFYHIFLQISSWCLVLLTLDRFIAVIFVFKYQTWCKRLHVVKVFIAILLLILLLNMHLLIFINATEKSQYTGGVLQVYGKTRLPIKYKNSTNKIRPLTTIKPVTPLTKKVTYVCNVSYEKYPFYFKNFYTKWDIYHAVIYGALPFILVFTSNIIIIAKLIKRHRKMIKYKDTNRKLLDPKAGGDPLIKPFQLTFMLLTVSFAFLILTSPISIYMAFIYGNIKSVRESKRELIKVILRYIAYFNNAINFYIYLTTSSEFRRELSILFRSCLPRKGGSSIYTACTTTTTSLPDITIETKKPKSILKVKNNDNYQIEYSKAITNELSNNSSSIDQTVDQTVTTNTNQSENRDIRSNRRDQNNNAQNGENRPFLNRYQNPDVIITSV